MNLKCLSLAAEEQLKEQPHRLIFPENIFQICKLSFY